MQAPEPERGSVDSSMVDYIPQGTRTLLNGMNPGMTLAT